VDLHLVDTAGRGSINGVNPQTVPTVSVPELADQLPANSVLLDVREDDEWAAGHAPDAVHIPLGEIAGRLDELPADSSLFVVCRAGGRSARATAYLNANGWDATNVAGGMQSWAQHGRPLACELPGADPEII
jgi:rhodanese-related sulfurtransferase